VIATRSGLLVVDDDCVVSTSEKAPGDSKASPEGKAAMAAAKEEEHEEQAQAAADAAKAKH
jgi:hypothetical protein